MKAANTYDEWLALSDAEKEEVSRSWNVYIRDAIGIPLIAAGRLALVSPVKVLDGRVGTYHSGEYVLHMFISKKDAENPELNLQKEFEGFRVFWMPET